LQARSSGFLFMLHGKEGDKGSNQPLSWFNRCYEDLGDGRLSILVAVVEDEESFRESLEGLLQAVGHEVLLYLSGEDFLQSGRLADIDCLITDFGLPGMDGIDLLRAARAVRPDLPVIVITARPEPSILSRALAAGAHRAFKKPVNSTDLLKAVTGAK
jgi:FixJ family two-component response regulator